MFFLEGGGGTLSVSDKVSTNAHGMYPATLNIRSVYLNSPSVVTRLLFNIYKHISDCYVNVILPGNVGGGGGGEGNTHCCVGIFPPLSPAGEDVSSVRQMEIRNQVSSDHTPQSFQHHIPLHCMFHCSELSD